MTETAEIPPRAEPAPAPGPVNPRGIASWRLPVAVAVLAAAAIAGATFYGEGGLQLEQVTWVGIAAILLGAVLVGAAVASGPRHRLWGAGALAAFATLFVLTALSVTWSLQPALSWQEANRTLAYLAVFAGGIAAVRLLPGGWRWLLYGLLGGLAVVSLYALATKVFPGTLSPDETYARLREPFGYWNAVGLAGGLGLVLTLWLGTRRDAGRIEELAAYPLFMVFAVTMLMSYSRGSILAAAAGMLIWLVLVPLRLRSAALIAGGSLASAAVLAFAFSRDTLTHDSVPLAARSDAGTELGLVLLAGVVIAVALGEGLRRLRAWRPLSETERGRIGRGLLVAIGATVVIAIGGLLVTGPGPDRFSNAWTDLTSEESGSPANEPERLTAASNVRATYWREAGRIWSRHRAVGAGAGAFETVRLRHRRNTLNARHAHGYVPQTMADLGLLGLVVSLVLLGAWGVAARRPLMREPDGSGLGRRDERVGLVALAAVVGAFGVHSFLDWSWFVPGLALPAIFAAGWLAGRGPLSAGAEAEGRAPLGPRVRLFAVAAVAVVALTATWTAVQPLRASERSHDALELARDGQIPEARAAASDAERINPLSVEPLFDRAVVEVEAGDLAAAEEALEDAVQLQPANPEAWRTLGRFQLAEQGDAERAQDFLAAAVFLDPRSPSVRSEYLDALAQASAIDAVRPEDGR